MALLGISLGRSYLLAVEFHKRATRLKMRARDAARSAARDARLACGALFHTHDFTEGKLALVEGIVGSFKETPLLSLSARWRHQHASALAWASVGFIDGVSARVTRLLDDAVDGGLRRIRRRFHEAWSADAACAELVGAGHDHLREASCLLGRLR